jgi:hypothetical protein
MGCPRFYLRMAAVLFSLCLAGALIAYRAGALDAVFMSSSKTELIDLGKAYQELMKREAEENVSP